MVAVWCCCPLRGTGGWGCLCGGGLCGGLRFAAAGCRCDKKTQALAGVWEAGLGARQGDASRGMQTRFFARLGPGVIKHAAPGRCSQRQLGPVGGFTPPLLAQAGLVCRGCPLPFWTRSPCLGTCKLPGSCRCHASCRRRKGPNNKCNQQVQEVQVGCFVFHLYALI